MNERLEVDGLRAFLAVVTHGGVTRAAAHLSLSQPAVSHKIRRLETILDCDLLTRRTGGPLLTESGERLLDYARRMVELHDETVASLSKRPVKGTIRLGMTEDTTGGDLARILGRFARLHPGTKVRTQISQSLTLQAWLEAGEIDLAAMQIFRRDVRPGDRILTDDRLHWVRARDLKVDFTAPIPLLAFDRNCFYKHWAQGEGSAAGHQFECVFECPSIAGVLSTVRAGLGVALINEMHLTDDLEVIRDVLPEPPAIAYVLRSLAKTRNEALRALVDDFMRELPEARPMRIA